MTPEQEVLKRINILLFHISDAVVNGGLRMDWIQKSSDEIDVLIDRLETPKGHFVDNGGGIPVWMEDIVDGKREAHMNGGEI